MCEQKWLYYIEEGSWFKSTLATPFIYGGLLWPFFCFAAGWYSYNFWWAIGGGLLGLLSGLPIVYFASAFCSRWEVTINLKRQSISYGESSPHWANL